MSVSPNLGDLVVDGLGVWFFFSTVVRCCECPGGFFWTWVGRLSLWYGDILVWGTFCLELRDAFWMGWVVVVGLIPFLRKCIYLFYGGCRGCCGLTR